MEALEGLPRQVHPLKRNTRGLEADVKSSWRTF